LAITRSLRAIAVGVSENSANAPHVARDPTRRKRCWLHPTTLWTAPAQEKADQTISLTSETKETMQLEAVGVTQPVKHGAIFRSG